MNAEITKNLISEVVNDFDTTYTISAISKTFTSNFSNSGNWSLQVIWAGLTGILDGTVQLQGSNDGINFDNLSGVSNLVLITASGSGSFRKDKFDFKYFRVLFTKNNLNNTGTLKLLLNIKK